MQHTKKTLIYISIVILASLSAINYIIFIFPNGFASSGLDGICTMIQDTFNVNMGYLSLLLNLPLILSAYIYLNRDFAIRTTLYIVSFSLAVIFLKDSSLCSYCYITESGSSIILAPIVAGAIRGIIYSFTLKANCCSGGIDIVAAVVKKKMPHLNLMNIIFFINMTIAASSYFVYAMRFDPVICSIIYSFITSSTSKKIQADEKETVKFEIITSHAQTLYEKISSELHLPATIMEAHGAYSGENKEMIICVTDKSVAPLAEKILTKFPDCVVFKTVVDSSQMIVNYSKSGV